MSLRVVLAAHVALLGLLIGVPALSAAILAGYVAMHAALAWGTLHPRSRLFGPNLSRLSGSRRAVALTFDDGPHPAVTPGVLSILAARGAKATFFVIGKWVEDHPEIARRIVEEGHALGNHTFRHSYLFWANAPGRVASEVERTGRSIEAATGAREPWFRCPVGLKSLFLHRVLDRRGLRLVSWDVRVPCDAAPAPEALRRMLRRRIRPGSIVLLHDGHDRRPEGRPEALRVLPIVLDELESMGYECVALDGEA